MLVSTESHESAARKKSTGAHFTPPQLARLMSQRLAERANPRPGCGLRVLDPACGDGELLLALAGALPPSVRKRSMFIGVESDQGYLHRAESRAAKLGAASIFVQGDFLEIARSLREAPLLRNTLPHELIEAPIDLIIANPPYVRTQILGSGRAQDLAQVFGLTGRVDLYHAFFVAMSDFLAPAGLLGVITSNRYLTTKGGASVRDFLASEYEILEVLDLGDTKLFEAAVLPAIFFGKRKRNGAKASVSSPTFVRIYEDAADSRGVPAEVSVPSVIEILSRPETGRFECRGVSYSVTTGRLSIPTRPSEPWSMTTEGESDWVMRVDSRTDRRICDIAKVRVGIKSTADPVFIRSDWDRLPSHLRPEPELLKPLLSHDDAQRWHHASTSEGPSRRILYTHELREGKRRPIDLAQFPRAARYLMAHRERLDRRRYVVASGRKWYEIWVPQDPAAWGEPKLVFPDISPGPKFFYEDKGCLVDGNCYWITLLPEVPPDILFLILGVANSDLATRYYDLAFQNRLYSGRRRYLTQYVERFPLPPLSSPSSRRVIELARRLSEPARVENIPELESEINRAVALAFGIPATDQRRPSGRNRRRKTSVSNAVT